MQLKKKISFVFYQDVRCFRVESSSLRDGFMWPQKWVSFVSHLDFFIVIIVRTNFLPFSHDITH